MGTTTNLLNLNKPANGEYVWGDSINQNADILDSVVGQLLNERAVAGSATGGGATSLIDTSANFDVNALVDAIVTITRGTSIVRTSKVLSNTSDTLTFASGAQVVAGDSYLIMFNGASKDIPAIGGVSSLRTLQPSEGTVKYLAYHTIAGDGGHGVFRAVIGAAIGTYVDNGGTVIVPTGGDGSAAWLLDYNTLSLAQSGAKGNGITIDAAPVALSTAIDDSVIEAGKIYALSDVEISKARVSSLAGRGVIRNRGLLASHLHTDYNQFDLIGFGKSIAGSAEIAQLSNLPDANLNTLNDALLSGTVNVTYFGDSITENNSANGFYESSWVRNTEKMLENSFPNATFHFDNKGIGGATSSNAVDPAFIRGVGTFGYKVKPTTFPIGLGWWATNSVDNVAWIDQVKATNPDLLFVGFGMNDLQAAPDLFSSNIEAIIAATKTWTKQPTICLVSTYLPTDIQGAPYDNASNRSNLESHCRMMLALAAKHKCLCLDAFRMYRFMRDGADDRHHTMIAEFNWRNFATWWTVKSGSPTFSAGVVSAAAGFSVLRPVPARDVVIDLTVTVTNAGTVPRIEYRNNIGTTGNGYTVLWSGTSIVLFYGTTNIGSVNVGAIPLSAQYIRVEAIDTVHSVYLNGTRVLRVVDYHSLRSGHVAIIASGVAASVSMGLNIKLGQPRRIGRPLVSVDEIVGKYLQNDPLGWNNASEDSEGGNAINHPTSFMQGASYITMFGEVIKRIVSSFERHSKTLVVSTDVTNTTTTYTSTGLSLLVSGNAGDIVDVYVEFPYIATVAAGLLQVRTNGVSAGYGSTRYLDVTTKTHGDIMMMRLPVKLVLDGVNTIGVVFAAGAGGTITSNSATTSHFAKKLTVTKV